MTDRSAVPASWRAASPTTRSDVKRAFSTGEPLTDPADQQILVDWARYVLARPGAQMRRTARAVQAVGALLILVGVGQMVSGSPSLGAKVSLGAAIIVCALETNLRLAEQRRYEALRVLSEESPEPPRWRPGWLAPKLLGIVTWTGLAVYLVVFVVR